MSFDLANIDPVLIINSLNYTLLLGLLLAMLFGFIRGIKKSFIRMLTRIIPLLILFLFLDVFGLQIIHYDFSSYFTLSQGKSLHEITLYYASDALKTPVVINSEIEKLITAITLGVARIFIFYIGVILCGGVTAILNLIFSIILKITKRKVKPSYLGEIIKKPRKSFLSRLIGAGLGGLTYLLIFVIVVMPLFGPLSFVSQLEDEIRLLNIETENQVEVSQTNDELEQVFKIVKAFDGITFRTVINAFDKENVDALYFGYLTRIETENGTINIARSIDDIEDVLFIYGSYLQETHSYNSLITNEQTRINNFLNRNKWIAVISPAGIEYLESKEVVELDKSSWDELKAIDWVEENKALIDIIEKTINLMDVAGIDLNNPLTSLGKPEIDDAIGELAKTLINSKIVSRLGINLLNKELQKALDQLALDKNLDLNTLKAILDITKMSSKNWESDFKTLSNIARALYELGVFDGNFDYDETKAEVLKRLITKPFELSIINGHEQELIDLIIKATDLTTKLDELGLDAIDFSLINWEDEPVVIAEIVIQILKVIGDEQLNIDTLSSKIDTQDMKDLLDKILASDFFRTNLAVLLDNTLADFIDKQDNLSIDEKNELKAILKFSILTKEDFKSDFNDFLYIYKTLNDMNVFGDTDPDLTNFENLNDVLLKIFNLKLIDNNEGKVFNLLIDMANLRENINNLGIILKTDNIDWDQEPKRLTRIISAISEFVDCEDFNIDYLIDEISKEGGKDKVQNLLNALCESELFLPNIPILVDKALQAVNLEEWYSDWFNGQLSEVATITSTKWQIEMAILIEIINKSKYLDLTNLSFSTTSLEPLKELLLQLNQSNIFKLDPIKTYLEEVVNDKFSTLITINSLPSTQEEWENEIHVIFEVANLLNSLGSIEGSDIKENNPDIIALLNRISNSVMLKPLQKTIVQEMINKAGFNTYLNLDQVDFDQINWANELKAINHINNHFNSLTSGGKVEDLTGTVIANLMTNASHGQIATLIIGKVLNDQFNNLFGDNVPKDGLDYKYDFTKKDVIITNNTSMGKLMDLGKVLKDFFAKDINSITKVETDNLGDSIIALHEEEKTRPTFIDDYLPAIMGYAGKGGDITSDGLANYGKTYIEEGELLKQFFDAYYEKESNPVAFITISNRLYSESYLAKKICENWIVP